MLRSRAILPALMLLSTGYTQAQQKPSPARSLSASVRVSAIGNPVDRDYLRTQGQTLQGTAAPYVEEYAKDNSIDLQRLGHVLFPKGYPPPPASGAPPVLISSYEYKRGDWTYFESRTVVLYDLLEIRGDEMEEPMLLLLYSHATPDSIIIDRFEAEWRLALVNTGYQVISDVPFTTRIKHHEKGVWDMIYTGLTIENAAPVVRIMYTHTGGGGGRDQEFTFLFEIERQPRLKLLEGKQTLDEYDAD